MENNTTDAEVSPVNADLLRTEYEHINSYIRTSAQLHLAWYTFFVTVNYAVLGYMASQYVRGAATDPSVLVLAIVLIVQGVLAIIACVNYESYIKKSEARITTILKELTRPNGEAPNNPIPGKLYHDTTILMIISFAALLLFWLVILVRNLIGAFASS
jgi:hypothetical protein